MGQTTFQRSFSGGELAPALAARADTKNYLSALSTCRNFLVRKQGGVANRAGLRYVAASKNDSTAIFLLRYVSEVAGDSVLIEAGPFYLRFYKNGGIVVTGSAPAWSGAATYQIGDLVFSGGVTYYNLLANNTNHAPPDVAKWYPQPAGGMLEVPTPFGNAGFKWVQSSNVITMTDQLVAPQELIYLGPTTWRLQPVVTDPSIDVPTSVVLSLPVANPGAQSYSYVVTAGAASTLEESYPSAIQQINTIATPTPDKPVKIAWTPPVAAADEYYIYADKNQSGTFGFVGVATGQTSFLDTGIIPDLSATPPQIYHPFATSNDYPDTAANYQQRRYFANSINNPDAVFGSRTGFRSNFSKSSPLQDDDSVAFKLAANQHNPIRNMVGLRAGLIILTDAGEWVVSGGLNSSGTASVAIAPNAIDAEQEAYVGASDVAPVVVGNALIYVQARGAIVHDLQFDMRVEGLGGRDLTTFATHLFEGYTLDDLDYQQTPDSTVWFCRSDGALLGLTYFREQDILGWHRHDTSALGQFEHVCVVPEPGEDVLYLLVRRTIGGVIRRYIEKLESRTIQNWNVDSFFVDAGLTYNGAPATVVAGLGHLIGQVVAVVADGVVIYNGDPLGANAAQFTVDGTGTIPHVLTTPASVIHAGLAIRYPDIVTLDLDVAGSAVRDKEKKTSSVSLLLDNSTRSYLVGPDTAHLVQNQVEDWELSKIATSFTGQAPVTIQSTWDTKGRIMVRLTDPLPLTILGIMPNSELGG